MIPHVTRCAIESFQALVADVSDERAIEALSSPVIRLADDFGAPVVRLGSGERVVLKNHAVVTVLPAEHPPTIANQRHAHAPRCFWPPREAQ